MRPWMKTLAIGGVMGVALGVSLASEKPAVRRSAPPAVNSQPERLEFISRGGTTSEQSYAPVDPTTDHVAEELAAEASSAPKRFSRSKTGLSEDPVSVSSTKAKLKPVKSASPSAGNHSDLKPTSSTMNKFILVILFHKYLNNLRCL